MARGTANEEWVEQRTLGDGPGGAMDFHLFNPPAFLSLFLFLLLKTHELAQTQRLESFRGWFSNPRRARDFFANNYPIMNYEADSCSSGLLIIRLVTAGRSLLLQDVVS